MEYQLFMSYIIVGLIWISMIILSLILYFLFPPEIYYWNKVCDKCSTKTAKHRYVVRFIFSSFKPPFDLLKTNITLEVWNEKRAIVVLQITSKQMEGFINNCPRYPQKTVRFLLYRKEPLLDIKHVIINHDGVGYINVSNVEIQDLTETMANISYVGSPVYRLKKDKVVVAQKYPSGTREKRSVEPELKPSMALSAIEYIVFFFLAINSILLSTVYLIPCPKELICNDYRDGLIASVFSGLTASSMGAAVLVMSCCFYRYGIKKSIYRGIKLCYFLRYMSLILAVVVGAAIGLLATLMAAENRKFPRDNPGQDFFHELFWMFAVGIALTVFFLFWISVLSLIGYLIGFFSEPSEDVKDIQTEDKTMRTDTEEDGDENDYMKQMMKNNQKVKSISQYGGLSQKKATQEPPPSMDTRATKRTQSVESTGSNYYKQLMKDHKKVKSVSQYQGPGK